MIFLIFYDDMAYLLTNNYLHKDRLQRVANKEKQTFTYVNGVGRDAIERNIYNRYKPVVTRGSYSSLGYPQHLI